MADRRMVAVAEVSFTEWSGHWDKWRVTQASTPSEGPAVSYEDKRRETDRRKMQWASPQNGRERRHTAERHMIEVREVGLDQWLYSIDSNMQQWSPP